MEELTNKSPRIRINERVRNQFVTSRLLESRLIGDTPAEYWCQVTITTADNRTLLLEESLRALLLPEVAYRDLLPCPFSSFLFDAEPRCATDKPMHIHPTGCTPPIAAFPLQSSNLPFSFTPTMPNCSESMNTSISDSRESIPVWGYALMCVGGVAVIGGSVVMVGFICYRRRRRRMKSSRANGNSVISKPYLKIHK